MVTALDDRPRVVVEATDVAAELGRLRVNALNEAEQYAMGYADGLDAGYAAAHREVAQWWAQLARSIRRDADRLRGTVPEPIDRSSGHHDGITWRDWFTPAELEILDGGQ
jgi:hypothetical protein